MKIIQLFSAPKGISGGVRPTKEELNLIVNHGIENDKFALKDLNQTVMILGVNSYEMAKSQYIDLQYGSLGENILLDFDPHTLPIGTKIQLDEAIIQITQRCTICNHLSVFDKKLPKLLKDHRGLYCKIVSSGIINKNSKVTIY